MSAELSLFGVLVGGMPPGGNIEVHDVRFVCGRVIEDTFDTLRREWWGLPEEFHIDAFIEVTSVDGYAVHLRPDPSSSSERLYFVNLGGYDPSKFTELHESGFFVGTSEKEVSRRAKDFVTTPPFGKDIGFN